MTTGHSTRTKHEMPVPDISKLLDHFRLPGIDLPALAEAQRKNIEALTEANQKAYSGALALAQRQAEILEETMSQWQSAAKELTSKARPRSRPIWKAIETALANMRELAEMAFNSQAEAYDVMANACSKASKRCETISRRNPDTCNLCPAHWPSSGGEWGGYSCRVTSLTSRRLPH